MSQQPHDENLKLFSMTVEDAEALKTWALAKDHAGGWSGADQDLFTRLNLWLDRKIESERA